MSITAPKMIVDMAAVDLAALSAVVGKDLEKESKGNLEVGVHKVDFTVRVVGQVKKGENYEVDARSDLNAWAVVAAFVKGAKTVDEAVIESKNVTEAEIADTKMTAEARQNDINPPQKKMASGKTTVKLQVMQIA